MATVTAVLLASLFGSLHCVGMCGALLAFAVGSTEDMSNVSRIVLNVAYNGGRLLTYALLGVVSGLLGAALDLGASMVGLHRVAALLAGAMMVALGTIAQRLAISGESLIPPIRVTEEADARQQILTIQTTPLPCCREHNDGAMQVSEPPSPKRD